MNKKVLSLLLICFSMVMVNAQDGTKRFNEINKEFSTPASDRVLIAAHRGAHLDAPENSLLGFQQTIDMGIDIIELDVRCTKDGQLVVIHDKTVNRTTTGKGPVDSFTLEQIRQLRLLHKGKPTEEKIPTLKEALLLAKGKILVDLDIKSEGCIEKIMQEVKETQTQSTCFFFVGEADHVTMLKQRDASFRTLLRTHSEKEARDWLTKVKTEAVHIDLSHHTAEVVSFIKKSGARVWINALDEVDQKAAAGNVAAFEEVLNKGANIIQTDQPALLKEYLIRTKRYF
jgi:glycerophosphoryl diester phosphodiesterase